MIGIGWIVPTEIMQEMYNLLPTANKEKIKIRIVKSADAWFIGDFPYEANSYTQISSAALDIKLLETKRTYEQIVSNYGEPNIYHFRNGEIII